MGNLRAILTNVKGKEVCFIKDYQIDIDLNKDMNFELTIPTERYSTDYRYWTRVFVPNTEYGGLIGGREIQTFGSTVKLTGMTWRGKLNKYIIEPEVGEDYKIVSGELNNILRELISDAGAEELFFVPYIDTGISVNNFQFKRYTSLYKGIVDLYKSVDYKIDIQYIQQEQGLSGYVQLQALPVIDYSEYIELSQNSKINFTLKENVDGINHLICLGQGDLKARQVIHLYLQEDGTIGDTQYYFGLNEITEIYDYSNVESIEDLRKYGIERFMERASKKSFEADVDSLDTDVNIGDIIGGRDYITGAYLYKPITNKIYKAQNDIWTVEYSIEGEDTEPEIQ